MTGFNSLQARHAKIDVNNAIVANINDRIVTMNIKAQLSTLWMFVLFNITFRDIHEILKPAFLEEVMTGTVNGVQLTEGLFLLGGVMIEVPILMVLLSRLLKSSINRWANIIAGAITIVFVINNGVSDLDDMFFAAIEIAALLFVIGYAWKWPKQFA